MVEVFELVSSWLFLPDAENTRPFIHVNFGLDSSISKNFFPSQPTSGSGISDNGSPSDLRTYGPPVGEARQMKVGDDGR